MKINYKKIKERFKSLFFMEMPDLVEIKSDEAMVIAIDFALYQIIDLESKLKQWASSGDIVTEKIDELNTLKEQYEDSSN